MSLVAMVFSFFKGLGAADPISQIFGERTQLQPLSLLSALALKGAWHPKQTLKKKI